MDPQTAPTPDNTNPNPAVPQQPTAPIAPVAPVAMPSAPIAPAAPVGPAVPDPSAMPPGKVTPGAAPKPARSKKPFIFAAIAVVLVLIIGLVAFPAIAMLQAKQRSDGFMKEITAGNVDGALKFVNNGGDAEDKTFLKSASDSVKGSFKYKESTKKDSKFYALYDLSGGKYVSARTEFSQQSGKWYLDGFVYDTQQLALVPAASTEANKKSTTTDSRPAAKETSALSCLTQDDYKWISYDKQPFTVTFDDTYNPEKFTFNKIEDMFFKPDSVEEDSIIGIYDDWMDFAKRNENKQWKFRLEGSTFGADSATAASKKLANDRAERVVAQLVKRGLPKERIVIDPPHDYSDEEQDALSDIYRRVQLIVDPTCTAASASTGNR